MALEFLHKSGFILNHGPRKPVQHPGSRGGRGYWNHEGHWVYGERPTGESQFESNADKEAFTFAKQYGDQGIQFSRQHRSSENWYEYLKYWQKYQGQLHEGTFDIQSKMKDATDGEAAAIDRLDALGVRARDTTTDIIPEERSKLWTSTADQIEAIYKAFPELNSLFDKPITIHMSGSGKKTEGDFEGTISLADNSVEVKTLAVRESAVPHEVGHLVDIALHHRLNTKLAHASQTEDNPVGNLVKQIKEGSTWNRNVTHNQFFEGEEEWKLWLNWEPEVFARFFARAVMARTGYKVFDAHNDSSFPMEYDEKELENQVEQALSTIGEPVKKSFNIILSHERKPVQHPGSRGGKGYYTNQGRWVYGTRPVPHEHLHEQGDLALAVLRHMTPYLESVFSSGVAPIQFLQTTELVGNDFKTHLRETFHEDAAAVEEQLSAYVPDNFIPKLIGAGGYAVAVQLSPDKVARIVADEPEERPKYPWMLQSIAQGEHGYLHWEIVPKVELVADTSTKKTYSQEAKELLHPSPKVELDMSNLNKLMRKDGYSFSDKHAGNIGYYRGNPVVIDPGAAAYDPYGNYSDEAQGIKSKAPKTSEEPEAGDHIAAIEARGYKLVDKTMPLGPEEREETWKAINAVTQDVEQAFPEIKDLMARQPLVLNVTSASQGNGVRGEHHRPQFKGDPNSIDISSEYPRTFMHELGHYVDSAAAQLHPGGQWDYRHVLSDMYNTPMFNVVAKIKTYPEYRQWLQERPRNERAYWSRNSEIFGRFFDQWEYHKLGKSPSDSYEPLTEAELEEAGKLLDDGLRQLKLIKSMLGFGIEPQWVKSLMSSTLSFSPDKPPVSTRPIKPCYILKHKKVKREKGYVAETKEQPSLKSSFGVEPGWIQSLFKAGIVIPESEAQKQTAIGSEGGKYYIGKDGVKHYGPYGEEPPEHLKVPATEQPYIHEQAPQPVPEPPQKKGVQESIPDFVVSYRYSFTGGTKEFQDFVNEHQEEITQIAFSGQNNLKKLAASIGQELEDQGSPDDNDSDFIKDALFGFLPKDIKTQIRFSWAFEKATDPGPLLDTSLAFLGLEVRNLSEVNSKTIENIVGNMFAQVEANIGRDLTLVEREKLYNTFKETIVKRIKDYKDMTENIRTFSHTITIHEHPAAPPAPGDWDTSGEGIEDKIRKEHPNFMQREDWKIVVSKQIGQRMIAMGITEEMVKEYFKVVNHRPRTETEDLRVSAADDMIASWASSSDGTSALSLSIQRLTPEVFPGAARWDTIQPWNDDSAWDWSTRYMDNPVFKQVATAFLYAQYQNTQEYFKKLGVTELTVGRGAKVKYDPIAEASAKAKKESKSADIERWVASGILEEDKHVTNPLSSWGWDAETDTRFSGGSLGGVTLPSSDQEGTPIMVAAKIPAARVLGGFFSGNGAENEHEVVVIGSEKPVDKFHWMSWGDTNSESDMTTRVKAGETLLKGTLPTNISMKFMTPALSFSSDIKYVMSHTRGNWFGLTDEQIKKKLQEHYHIKGIAKIPLDDGQTITIKKAIPIVQELASKGHGQTPEQVIDNVVMHSGLESVMPNWYTTDEAQYPGKFQTTSAIHVLQDYVNSGVIEPDALESAAKYLTEKVKEMVKAPEEGPVYLRNTTPNKVVFDKTKKFLGEEENKGIVEGLSHTVAGDTSQVDIPQFVESYLGDAIIEYMDLDKGMLSSDQLVTLKQSAGDALTDALQEKKPIQGTKDVLLEFEETVEKYVSGYSINLVGVPKEVIEEYAEEVTNEFTWSSPDIKVNKESLQGLAVKILGKIQEEHKDKLSELLGENLSNKVQDIVEGNPNFFKNTDGSFISFSDMLVQAESLTEKFMEEQGLDYWKSSYSKDILAKVKLVLRKFYKAELAIADANKKAAEASKGA